MPNEIIPRDRWSEMLQALGRLHREWRATLEVTDADQATRTIVSGQPLLDLRETGETICLELGTPKDSVTWRVPSPIVVSLEIDDRGAHEGLSFRSAEGSVTRLCFESPVAPESVNGFYVR